jgi:hypothetical protein
LDFFSPSCDPCREKVPALVAKRGELEARGAKLVLVAVLADSESTNDAQRSLASWGVSEGFLVDKGGVSNREAGVSGLPATLVLDADGGRVWTAPPTATAADVLAHVP